MIDRKVFDRTIKLLGEEKFNILCAKTIAVFGLGGVGGMALECLIRSGFRSFILVDFDIVNKSNLNRQILYTHHSVNKKKVDEAKKRILDINPNALINVFNMKVDYKNISFLDKFDVDFVVDAIDDIKGKIAISKYCLDKKIPFVVSLGMANRIDPTKLEIIRLDKTTNDPLGKKVRYEFKSNGLETKKIMCVFSKEKPQKDGTNLNSMMMVPSCAGLLISYYIIDSFIGGLK